MGLRSEKGFALVWAAIVLSVMLLCLSAAIELGRMHYIAAGTQGAADAAALAGAMTGVVIEEKDPRGRVVSRQVVLPEQDVKAAVERTLREYVSEIAPGENNPRLESWRVSVDQTKCVVSVDARVESVNYMPFVQRMWFASRHGEAQACPVALLLQVTPPVVYVGPGQTASVRVTARMSNGTTKDVTAQASYVPGDPAVARIPVPGLIAGVASGTAYVEVSWEGLTTTCNVVVGATGLDIMPRPLDLWQGTEVSLWVVYRKEDGSAQDVTQEASCRIADPSIATVVGPGRLCAVREGTTVLEARWGSHSTQCTVRVLASVSWLEVDPAAMTLRVGERRQLRVWAVAGDGSRVDVTGACSYSSSDPLIAWVSSDGVVTAGYRRGTARITASYGGKSGTCRVDVVALPTRVEVVPSQVELYVGGEGRVRAFAYYPDGSQEEVTGTATWASSNTGVAEVSGSGVLRGVSAGSCTVSASYMGRQGICQVLVRSRYVRLEVVPAQVELGVGEAVGLRVWAVAVDGSRVEVTSQASYRSSNSAVASVAPGGQVTARAPGRCTITASWEGLSGECQVTVVARKLAGVGIQPPSLWMSVGQVREIRVYAYYSDGSRVDVTGAAQYWTSNSRVAVAGPGYVSAVGPGQCTVTAQYGGKTGTCYVSVGSPWWPPRPPRPLWPQLLFRPQVLQRNTAGTARSGGCQGAIPSSS